MQHCLINGQPIAGIGSDHRLAAFGDGLFETCFVSEAGVQFMQAHLDRLARGARRLDLVWGDDDHDALIRESEQALQGLSRPCVLKWLIGRGVNGRGYDYDPARQRTDRIVQVSPYQPPPWLTTGAHVVLGPHYASANPDLAGLKHCNRLDSVLARRSARQAGAHEVWQTLPDGRLLQGSMSNLYLCLAGQWFTPRLDMGGVDGIIRRRLLQAPGFELTEADLYPRQLDQIEAALISNALIGVVPVTRLDDRPLSAPSSAMLSGLRRKIGLIE